MKLKTISISLTLLLLAALAAPVLADATITVSGGTLSVTPQAVAFAGVTLNGADQTSTGTSSAWSASDLTGSGSGWHINVKATDFSDGAGNSIAVGGFRIQLQAGNISTVAGNTAPSSQIASLTALSTTDQSLLSAASGAGMGTYNFTPNFDLAVPAETFAGSYSSTVTVSAVSGP